MKSFKQLSEELTLSEVDVIGDVVSFLASVKENAYETKEEALEEIASIVSELGLTFDMEEAMDAIESGNDSAEIPLKDIGGEDVSLSVFAGESLEDKVEGELFLKLSIDYDEGDARVTLDPEIVAYFDDEEAKSLADIEFEMADADSTPKPEKEDEPEEKEVEEDALNYDGENSYCDGCDRPKNQCRCWKNNKEISEAKDDEEVPAEEPEATQDAPEEEPDSEATPEEETPEEDPFKLAVADKIKELDLEADEEKITATVDFLVSQLQDYLAPPEEEGEASLGNEIPPMTDEPVEDDDEESQVDIFEEVDTDSGIWNATLMKPTTRLIISRILAGKTAKAVGKIIEKEYPEFIILSLDPVIVYDVSNMESFVDMRDKPITR